MASLYQTISTQHTIQTLSIWGQCAAILLATIVCTLFFPVLRALLYVTRHTIRWVVKHVNSSVTASPDATGSGK